MMESLRMCRCCLLTDVRMSYVSSHNLLDIITHRKIASGWVCYICMEFLKKLATFREACLASEVLLLELYTRGAHEHTSLSVEDAMKRDEIRQIITNKENALSQSNTLSISVVTVTGDDVDSRTNVWSFISKDDSAERQTMQSNYCDDMEEWGREERHKIHDVVLPFVKVECDNDVKLLDMENHDKMMNIDQDDNFCNDLATDSEDDTYNVPLINVAMMAAGGGADAKILKDEKVSDIKREDGSSVEEDEEAQCKYCGDTFSRATYLPGHYRTCTQRRARRAANKRGHTRHQAERHKREEDMLQDVSVIKIEPVDVDAESMLCGDITLSNAVVKVKKKKKKRSVKGREEKMVEDQHQEAYGCDVCSKTFVKQTQLQRHTLTHTGERPFKCDFSQCDYSSSRADDLKKHLRKHTGDRPFSCTVDGCQFTSSYAHHLNRHMRAHNGTKEFMCDTCGKKFRESNVLKQHQLSAHSAMKPYTCEECDYTTAYPNLLKDHQTQVHRTDGGSGKNYICDECGHSYWRADQLKVHKRVHSGEKPFRCDVCSFATSHSNALKVHKRSHSNERPYVCEECAHAFARKDDLKTHMRIHSGDRPYACDKCPYTAAQKSNLKRHKISHLGIKPFCCDECGKRFAEASSLKMHKRLHAGVRPFKCPHCPYSTSQSGGLKRHLVSHSGEKPFVCHVCGKAFTLIYDLNNHSRIHTGEKPYTCDVCNFATSHHNALKIHKRSHTGEKPFRCDVCAQCFSRGGDLKTHKRIHTGEKPYACTVCCYTATQASNLKRHMVSHSGKKPFTCGDCGKSFTEAGTLRIHRRTHTGERPYCCHHCAQAFSQAGHLRKHMRLHATNTSTANTNNSEGGGGVTTAITNNTEIGNTINNASSSNNHLLGNIFKTNNALPTSNGLIGDAASMLNTDVVNAGRSSNNDSSQIRSVDSNNRGINLILNNDSIMDAAGHRCNDCGQMFNQMHSLSEHVSTFHSSPDVDDDKSNIIVQLTITPGDATC